MTHTNPLLKKSELRFGAVPFDCIRVSDYEEAITEGIRLHQLEVEAIAGSDDAPTFENTIAALDRSGKILSGAMMTLGNLEAALGDEELMEIMVRVTPLYSEHCTGILLNERLWDRVRIVYDARTARTDLSPEALRLIEETFRSFSESGAELRGESRERFRKLTSELSDLSVRFSQNVTNDMKNPQRCLWLRKEDLVGLPDSIREAAREAAREALEAEGKTDDGEQYLISMYMPSYVPFMKYAERRDLREKLYRLYNSRNSSGQYDNTQILKDIANIRLEIARLMGKSNFAEYHLSGTMAANVEGVMRLLENLRENYSSPMKKELCEVEDYAKKTEGDGFVLMPWDYSYWSEKLRNEKYAFSDEDMKPYFELTSTIEGVFGLATKLYGYTFRENRDIPVYHADVRAYEVIEDDQVLGILYADFFYRAGKSPGAWMTEFRSETKDDSGNRELPLISIVMNFSKPVGDRPVLLTPGEVRTFLHEFGHALHGLSSQAEFASLSGTNVYHDFVELFSQFNENYLTEKGFLDGFARHYETGEKMPDSLIAGFVRAGQYGAAYSCMRQLGFGYLDMAYHTIEEPIRASYDIQCFERDAQEKVKCFDSVAGCLTSPSFGHIFSGGYAAGYYGYKWSEVLDADAFSAFKENGIFDRATALRFKKMLQSGGTVDPMRLYLEFRGKEPSVDALLQRDGII
ncbi:MAG: M3 family metallopeptidase [Muribaculaceae bacterium]|nr:M3 family metallopeptidase [Muribaculaceae bacterium]